MTRIAWLFACLLPALAARADDAALGTSTMYVIGVTVKDVRTTALGDEKIAVIASPTIATVENRKAVYLSGGQTKIGDATVHSGTLLKVTLKKLDGNKAQVSGMLEVASFATPSDGFVEREATAYHFVRTVTMGEKTSLGKRPTAAGFRLIELQVEPPIEPMLPTRQSETAFQGSRSE